MQILTNFYKLWQPCFSVQSQEKKKYFIHYIFIQIKRQLFGQFLLVLNFSDYDDPEGNIYNNIADK